MKLVNELNEASELLETLLNNELDIAKLEEGKLEFNMEYESIYSILDLVINVTESKASKKNIEVIPEYGDNIPDFLELDKSRIVQIIMNLVGNAIKFTDKGGKVLIKVGWNSDIVIKQKPKSLNVKRTPKKSKFAVKKQENSAVWSFLILVKFKFCVHS